MLLQRQTLTLYQSCATFKIRGRILFHFQRRINLILTLIHNVEKTLSDVEMLVVYPAVAVIFNGLLYFANYFTKYSSLFLLIFYRLNYVIESVSEICRNELSISRV